MADNLKTLKERIQNDIDPAGAPGSILAQNHQEILFDVLNKVGKHTGFGFTANKVVTVFPNGTMSWESNAMNTLVNFDIKVSKLTADLNNFGHVLDLLSAGDLLKFKDFSGRSVLLEYVSSVADVDVSSNDIFVITVKGKAENINYTYQDAEQSTCIFEAINASATGNAPSGGTAGQILAKVDGTDFNFEWIDNDTVSEPLTFIFSGQSNMEGSEPFMNDGGDRATDSRVTIWNDVAVAWQTANLDNYPFGNLRDDGITYCNNLAFHTAKRIAERTNRPVRIIFEANGGQPISQWMGTGVSSPYWINILDKITDSGTTEINGMFWHQGETDGYLESYPADIQTLIDQFRGLTEVTATAPFIAGELAFGLDVNGDPTGGTASAGQKELNNQFYKVYRKFITDEYFGVAKGQFLPVVGSESGADGIHFQGTALVAYADLYADVYESMPNIYFDKLDIAEPLPLTLDATQGLTGSSPEFLLCDGTSGWHTVGLPLPKYGKTIVAKRVDAADTQFQFNIPSGYSINGVVDGVFKLLKQNDVVMFKPTSTTNYDAFLFSKRGVGVQTVVTATASWGNLKKHINIDASSSNAWLRLPPPELELDFYIKCVNNDNGAYIKHEAGFELDTNADINLVEGDVYYCYSDGTVYHTNRIVNADSASGIAESLNDRFRRYYDCFGQGNQDWKVIGTVTLGTGLYIAASFKVKTTYVYSNYGTSATYTTHNYSASIARSGGVQDDNDTVVVYGTDDSNFRIVKTQQFAGATAGIYELQMKPDGDYTKDYIEVESLSPVSQIGVGGSIVWTANNGSAVNATTAGTGTNYPSVLVNSITENFNNVNAKTFNGVSLQTGGSALEFLNKAGSYTTIIGVLITAKITLSSAQLLALNTTPIELISAPGSGKVINVHTVFSKYNYGTVDYATSTQLVGRFNGSFGIYFNITDAIQGSDDKITNGIFVSAGRMEENTALDIEALTSDPTAGDGTVDVHISYTITDL